MSEGFEKSDFARDKFADTSRVRRCECAGPGLRGKSDASGGAGAGEDAGGATQPDSKPVDPVGCLFVSAW